MASKPKNLWLPRVLQDMRHALYPAVCPGCAPGQGQLLGGGHAWLCPSCLLVMPQLRPGAPLLQETSLHLLATANIQGFESLLLFRRGNLAQRLVHALKFQRRHGLSSPLGRHMAALLAQGWLAQQPLVVPVPMAKAQWRARGFNQAERLAFHVAQAAGLPVQAQVLGVPQALAKSQSKKNRRQRVFAGQQFVVLQPQQVQGRVVCLVDDVCTTGQTLGLCAQALYQAGAQKVYALTLVLVV